MQQFLRYSTSLFLTVFLLAMATASAQPPQSSKTRAGYDRPVGTANQSRSATVSRNGMVATSQPLAAQAGIDILRGGGNAVDAAIAVNAMLGVVEPMSCGIGGDVFVIYWDNKAKKLYGLNGSGRSPKGLTKSVFSEKNLDRIPIAGPLSWSVPGCVRGWEDLSKRFGKQPLATVLQPAIKTAEEGFAVTQVISGYWAASQSALSRDPGSAETFLPSGRPPQFGEVFRNPKLAAVYRTIAQYGAQSFYEGEVAQAIVEFSKQQGGFFELEDFRSHKSEWVEPVSTTYRGHEVWELPPNGQGIAALQMLNVLEQHDLRQLGPNHPDYLHLFVESKKLAFADRAKFYADPQFSKVPTGQLISKAYGKQQNERIDLQKAATSVPAGDPQLVHGDTVYLTVVDKDRNCCSFIQSLYYGFGSKRTPPRLGFPLQNRGALFSLEKNHHNEYAPGKRPFHTIIPAMVTKDDRPWFCFGVMGGDMQPQGHVQVLVNMIDFEMGVQQAGDLARVRHVGSAQPTGQPADGGGVVLLESGISKAAEKQLQQYGHRTSRRGGSFGGYQGIRIDWKNGVLHGATEPRKDGVAIGY